jgi:hypothetical protein
MTAREPTHYLFDGTVVRAFIGTALVAVDAGNAAPLRVYARFTAVAGLDVLLRANVRLAVLPRGERPADSFSGLAATFSDTGARYRLAFDADDRLVWAAVSLNLAPLGPGELTARFSDFRRVGRFVLPFRTRYAFGDRPLADERARIVCPNPGGLDERAFADPTALPRCPDS